MRLSFQWQKKIFKFGVFLLRRPCDILFFGKILVFVKIFVLFLLTVTLKNKFPPSLPSKEFLFTTFHWHIFKIKLSQHEQGFKQFKKDCYVHERQIEKVLPF
jgi:hypothetical protein